MLAALVAFAVWWMRDGREEPSARPLSAPQPVAAEVESGVIANVAELEPDPDAPPSERDPVDTFSPTQLVVEVVSRAGALILDASVVVVEESGRIVWSGWTHEDGRCTIDTPELERSDLSLRVRAEGFRVATTKLVGVGAMVRVELTPVSALEGKVQRAGDAAAVPAAWIIAQPMARKRPTSDELLRLMAGEDVAGLSIARSDAQGRFSIAIDPERAPFVVRAGGGGWIGACDVEATQLGSSATVEVAHAYGARLRIVDGDQAPTISSTLDGRWFTVFESRDVGADAIQASLSDDELILAGADPRSLEWNPGESRILFLSPLDSPSLGPESVRIEPPGYEPISIDFDVQPLERGLTELVVPLVRTVQGFCTLEVRLAGATQELASALEGQSDEALFVFSRPGAADETRGILAGFRSRISIGRSATIDGAPRGTYEATLVFSSTNARVRSATPLLLEHDHETFDFSLANCGAVRLVPQSTSARREEFDITATLQGEGVNRTVRLRNDPRVIAPLPAGVYSLFNLHIDSEGIRGTTSFAVRAGACIEHIVRINP